MEKCHFMLKKKIILDVFGWHNKPSLGWLVTLLGMTISSSHPPVGESLKYLQAVVYHLLNCYWIENGIGWVLSFYAPFTCF